MLIDDDVATLIGAARSANDAILLDVDNGPDGLTRRVNDRLYSSGGLRAAMIALKPGGILTVWSADPDKAFTRRLCEVGLNVTEEHVNEFESGGACHMIWFAQKRWPLK